MSVRQHFFLVFKRDLLSKKGAKMNFFNNKKNQKIIAAVIALIVVAAMVAGVVGSFRF